MSTRLVIGLVAAFAGVALSHPVATQGGAPAWDRPSHECFLGLETRPASFSLKHLHGSPETRSDQETPERSNSNWSQRRIVTTRAAGRLGESGQP